MRNVIKDRQLAEDNWQLLAKDASADSLSDDAAYYIVPLGLWLAEREKLAGNAHYGVWLDSDESPEPIAGDCEQLPLVAINFPVFSDGRGYSYARILRDEYGYAGELRAIGDVLRDQLQFYARCGFNSFALREDCDATSALDSLDDFSVSYQAASDDPTPLFRRR